MRRFILRAIIGVLYFWILLLLAAKAFSADLANGVRATSILAALFLFISLGYLLTLSCWSLWLGLHSVRRVSCNGGELLVEPVFGQWQGPLAKVRLRKGARLPGYKWVRYRLELADGRGIGEIVMYWGEEQEKSLDQLKEFLCKHGARGEEGVGAGGIGHGAPMVRQAFSGFLNRQPWVGRLLFYTWLLTSYGGLVVAGARWSELSLVSLLSLGVVLVEVPFVVAALAAAQAGKGRELGLKSALKLLQIAWGCFVVSVLWDWLVKFGYSWLAALLASVHAGAIALESLVAGSVFGSSYGSRGDEQGALEKPGEGL
ncbi:MAG: hypothetical protein ACK42L_05650 [Thermoanaerobaculum sp.]